MLANAEERVRHLKEMLRLFFVTGVSHVFLWRFRQVFRCYRGKREFILCIFKVSSRRVMPAWMDLLEQSVTPTDTPRFADPTANGSITEYSGWRRTLDRSTRLAWHNDIMVGDRFRSTRSSCFLMSLIYLHICTGGHLLQIHPFCGTELVRPLASCRGDEISTVSNPRLSNGRQPFKHKNLNGSAHQHHRVWDFKWKANHCTIEKGLPEI